MPHPWRLLVSSLRRHFRPCALVMRHVENNAYSDIRLRHAVPWHTDSLHRIGCFDKGCKSNIVALSLSLSLSGSLFLFCRRRCSSSLSLSHSRVAIVALLALVFIAVLSMSFWCGVLAQRGALAAWAACGAMPGPSERCSGAHLLTAKLFTRS